MEAMTKTETPGLKLIPTEDVLALAGMSRNRMRYLMRKYPGLFAPPARVGLYMLWEPSVIGLLTELAAKIRPYRQAPRKGRKNER